MSYEVKQPNIFGRIGAGLGQGLAETIPKEIERYRMAEGLKKLGQKQDLDPFQAYTELLSIPGITPQGIQTAGELLKMRRQQQALRGSAGEQPVSGGGMTRGAAPSIPSNEQADLVNRSVLPEGMSPEYIQPTETGDQIVPENPTTGEGYSAYSWTPQQRDSRELYYINNGFLPEEAKIRAADDERRYKENPETYRKRLLEKEQDQQSIRDKFDRLINLKLERTGPLTDEKGQKIPQEDIRYKDISGDMLSKIYRSMERDAVRNPQKSFDDIANDWANKTYELAKTNSEFNRLAGTEGIENVFKGKQLMNRLKALGKSYEETGNNEEYFNELQSRMGFSPQAAAKIAYKQSPKVKNYIENFRPATQKGSTTAQSRKAAQDLTSLITAEDSLQSIVYDLKNKYKFFDEQAFFDELSSTLEDVPYTPRQRRELIQGAGNLIPTWADVFYLPYRS